MADEKVKKWYVLFHATRPLLLVPTLEMMVGKENVWWPHIDEEVDKVIHQLSIFPGYVFVQLERPSQGLEDNLKEEHPMVAGFLPMGHYDQQQQKYNRDPWVELTEEEVLIVKELEMNPPKELISSVQVKAGDIVQITTDVYAGLMGKVVSVDVERGVADILLVMFARETLAKCRLSYLRVNHETD